MSQMNMADVARALSIGEHLQKEVKGRSNVWQSFIHLDWKNSEQYTGYARLEKTTTTLILLDTTELTEISFPT